MTDSTIEQFPLTPAAADAWAKDRDQAINWPVVYTLSGGNAVYVGETINMLNRARQHLKSEEKAQLDRALVITDDTFNKSVCLDLESYLIRLFSGDGKFRVLNRNDGITNANYYNRAEYQNRFQRIFEELRKRGLFDRTIPQILNSDLFKLSPFKALTRDQSIAVDNILEALMDDLMAKRESTSPLIVRGQPGTGKTIVAIYLIKLLSDISTGGSVEEHDEDSMFSEYFTEEYEHGLAGLTLGLVIPQQSLRKSVKRVFERTPGLSPAMVLSPFDVGQSDKVYDVLLVDEAHRLNIRSAQASGALTKKFVDIHVSLFGTDDHSKTQLDWLRAKSRHQILMLDERQSVRPQDLPASATSALISQAQAEQRIFPLITQMRLAAVDEYIDYVRGVFAGNASQPRSFEGYDLRFFENLDEMRLEIQARNREHGLARLVAGYGWEWKSRKDKAAFDIVLDGVSLRWNTEAVDWINSPNSANEVGSIHTVQGYDLNWAGVIVGPELSLGGNGQPTFVRANYHDARGKANNKILQRSYSDEDILELVINIYVVLMTRGIRGTYVYVADEQLRARLRPFFDTGATSST